MICTLQLQVPIFIKLKLNLNAPPFFIPCRKQGRESSEVILFSAWDKERGESRFNFNYRLTHVII